MCFGPIARIVPFLACLALMSTVVGAAELLVVLAAAFPYGPASLSLLADAEVPAGVLALVVLLPLLPQPASTTTRIAGSAARRLIRFTVTPSGLDLSYAPRTPRTDDSFPARMSRG